MDNLFGECVETPAYVVYPLQQVDGWEKISREIGEENGSNGSYTLMSDMDLALHYKLVQNPDLELTFIGYFCLKHYSRRSTFRQMLVQYGAVNVVPSSKVGFWCLKLGERSGMPVSVRIETSRRQDPVCLVLSSPSSAGVKAYRGKGVPFATFPCGDFDYLLCKEFASDMEISVHESLSVYFFSSYMQEPDKYDYFSSSIYETLSYGVWSSKKHGPIVSDICSKYPFHHIVAPGDGIGLVASFAQNSTVGDLTLTPWTHPRVKKESFLDTMKRGMLEVGPRKSILLLSFIWHLMSREDRVFAKNYACVIVNDSVSPSSPDHPQWYMCGPGVWSTVPNLYFDGDVESRIDDVVPYSENLVRAGPARTFGAFDTWPKNMSLFGQRSGNAHTRISTILEMPKDRQGSQYFIQTGREFNAERVALDAYMYLLPRQIYYCMTGTSLDQHFLKYPHEIYKNLLYFWFHSEGFYVSNCDSSKFSVTVCVGPVRRGSIHLTSGPMGDYRFLVEDGIPRKYPLTKLSLSFVKGLYGDVEHSNLLAQASRMGAVIPEGVDVQLTNRAQLVTQGNLGNACRAVLLGHPIPYDAKAKKYFLAFGKGLLGVSPYEVRRQLLSAFEARATMIVSWLHACYYGGYSANDLPPDIKLWSGILWDIQSHDQGSRFIFLGDLAIPPKVAMQ